MTCGLVEYKLNVKVAAASSEHINNGLDSVNLVFGSQNHGVRPNTSMYSAYYMCHLIF